VLRDPEHVRKIIDASKQQGSDVSGIPIHEIAFGSSKAVANLLAGTKMSDGKQKEIQHMRAALTQKYLTGSSLAATTNAYVTTLSRNMNDKMFQVGSWTQIEDFWSFFQQVLTRCSVETFFGSAIFKQYPKLIKDYWQFEDAVEGFVPGMPLLLVSGSYKEPRDRLCQNIEKWLKLNHSGTEFAKIGDEDPDVDQHKGSKFVQESDDLLAKVPLPLEARTAEMLDIIHWYVHVVRQIEGGITNTCLQLQRKLHPFHNLDIDRNPAQTSSSRTPSQHHHRVSCTRVRRLRC